MKCFLLTLVFWILVTTVHGQDSGIKGQIAPELVGKWCYYNLANGDEGKVSNTCVTLNGDGTYEFFLDSNRIIGFWFHSCNVSAMSICVITSTSAEQIQHQNK